MGKKVTIVGGGSSTFVPHLLRLFIASEILKGSTITLMDVDPERLRVMETLARRLIEREGAELTIRGSTEQRAALTGADFVIVAISVGGMDAWERDIEIPGRYGIAMHVADSIGPGGIMRAFRHVPILASICRDLAEVSPGATVLNYTNPATANALAMRTVSTVRSLSLCSCSVTPRHTAFLAAWAGVDPDELATPALVAGLNHCAAIVELRLKDGRDALPLLRARTPDAIASWVRDRLGVTDEALIERFVRHTGIHAPVVHWVLDTYGILPYCWTHWLEFFPGLQRLAEPYNGRMQGLAVKYGPRIHDMTAERARARQWQELADRWSRPEYEQEVALANLPPGDEDEGIAVVEIIEDMVTNRNGLHVVNTLNQGAISNLPSEAVVEVLALVGSYGVRPVQAGSLPEPIAALLRHHFSTQQLTVQAALTGDRRLALQAFLLDPVLSANLEPEQTARLLDDLLRAHAAHLPRFA